MIIGLDYDGTITRNKDFWLDFLKMANLAGVRVVVVTMRFESEPITDFPAQVYYSGRQAKKPFMESVGVDVNIWIDDNPAWIYQNA